MLRGSVIVFTSFFARFLLRKHIKYIQWFGITIVIAGVLTVGITDIMYIKQTTANDAILNPTLSDNHTTHDLPTLNDILLGDLLVIGAQILVAAQITYEEKVVTKYDIPILHVLGLEGFFGTGLMSVLLIVMYFIPVGPKFGQGNPHHVMEDALDGKCIYKISIKILLLISGDMMIFLIKYTFDCRHVPTQKQASSVHHLCCHNPFNIHILLHCAQYYKDYG